MAVRCSDRVTLAVLLAPTSVKIFYLLQASGLNPPTVPGINPPPAPWTAIEPTYSETSTDTLYTITVTSYGTAFFEYGPVQKSSSYEAAKSAWNKAQAAQNTADSAPLYVQSRNGTDLVTNGTALLGNNLNFTSFTLDKVDTPTGGGSFNTPAGDNAVRFIDEYIPIDPARGYVFRLQAKQKGASTTACLYSGFAPYDIDKNIVNPQFYMYQANTTTTLASTLSPGNTTITLTSSANWNNAAGVNSHWRSLIVWNYTDLQGKTWPPETYSRNTWLDIYADGGISGNVITLKVPWAGPTIPAGTSVSNGSSGGTYMYAPNINTVIPKVWTTYTSTLVKGTHTNKQTSATTSFPPGTAYAKLMWLPNRTPAGAADPASKMSFAAVSFSDATAAAITAENIAPVISGTQGTVTNIFTGNAPFNTLVDGQQITYWIPYAGNGSSVTLQLYYPDGGNTGAVAVYFSGTTRLTTHLPAGSAARFTYRVNANVAGTLTTGWFLNASYSDGNTYDRVRYQQNISMASACVAGQLIGGSYNAGGVHIGFSPIVSGFALDILGPILYAQTAIAGGGNGSDNYTAHPSVTILNNKPGFSGTINKSVFLKGSLQGATFIVSSQIIVDTPIDDGSYYILLGQLYTTTAILLYTEHPIFRFYNGVFKSLAQIASDALATADDNSQAIDSFGQSIASHEDRLVVIEDDATGLPELRRTILAVQTSADGKNTIKRSIDPPGSATGVDGDQWWQYDGTDVIGFWLYDATQTPSWVLTKISSAIFGAVSASSITSGTLDASKLTISNFSQSYVDGLSDELSSLGQTANSAYSDVNELTNVITITPAGIKIGAQPGAGQTSFTMNLDADSLDFLENDVMVAQISSRKLIIRDAEISTTPDTSTRLASHEIVVGGTGVLLNRVTIFRSL